MDRGINRYVPLHFLYAAPNLNIESYQATKKGNSEGDMGSKSKINAMKFYKDIKEEAEPKKTKKGKRSRYNK